MMRKFRLAELAHPEGWECKIFLARPPAPVTRAVLETVADIMHRLWILEEQAAVLSEPPTSFRECSLSDFAQPCQDAL